MSVKISMAFFYIKGTYKSKSCISPQKMLKTQSNLEKEQSQRYQNFKLYYKAEVIKGGEF